MKNFFDTLTEFLHFRREYILFSAGISCVCFLLTAALFQNNELPQNTCLFETATEFQAEVPQTGPANSVLRGAQRFQRSVTQVRNSYFFNDTVPAESVFCTKPVKTFSTVVCNINCFRRFYVKKNPVRAGPAAV